MPNKSTIRMESKFFINFNVSRCSQWLLLVWLVALLLVVRTSHALLVQNGPKLVGTGAVGNAGQGRQVVLSTDGMTALVAGPNDATSIGATWIYTRNGGVWTQQGPKLVGTGVVGTQAYQGCSAALSSNGDTALVGGCYDNSYVGAAWVFVRSGGTWAQQGAKLVGTGYTGTKPYQGIGVALSSDGNTALVGGPYDGNVGAVWVFTRSGGSWSQQGAKLTGSGYIYDNQNSVAQGYSTALSGDGNTALIGGMYDNGFIGAAWVFTRSGNNWSQQGSKLVGTGYSDNPGQGRSVALSSNGNVALVSGEGDNDIGAFWVFVRSAGVWTQAGPKVQPNDYALYPQFGTYAALSSDGNTALVGGLNDNNQKGATWLFVRNTTSGTWSQQGSKLVGSGASSDSLQGISVGLSGDANTAIIGGVADQSNKGAAWIFVLSTSSPSLSPATSRPSRMPSRSPSRTPSNMPSSSKPSRTPSKAPTTQKPSRSPSGNPTTSIPSKMPSRSPSRTPSSSEPSVSPSTTPSNSPSVAGPSKAPSVARPSKSPRSSSPTTVSAPASSINVVGIAAGAGAGAIVVLLSLGLLLIGRRNRRRREERNPVVGQGGKTTASKWNVVVYDDPPSRL